MSQVVIADLDFCNGEFPNTREVKGGDSSAAVGVLTSDGIFTVRKVSTSGPGVAAVAVSGGPAAKAVAISSSNSPTTLDIRSLVIALSS